MYNGKRKDVNIRGNWVKGIQELSVLSLQLFCKSKIVPPKFYIKNRRKVKDISAGEEGSISKDMEGETALSMKGTRGSLVLLESKGASLNV